MSETSISSDAENWQSLNEPIAWRPSEEYLQRSRLRRFMERHGVASYPDLLARANSDPSWFWDAVSDDLGLVWQRPYTQVMDTSRGVPWGRTPSRYGPSEAATRASGGCCPSQR